MILVTGATGLNGGAIVRLYLRAEFRPARWSAIRQRPAVFNMKPTSFDQFAAKHAAIFRGEQPASRL